MKVYIVGCHNNGDYEDYSWSIMEVFTSKESAEKYIQKSQELYLIAQDRTVELYTLRCERPLTKEELEEEEKLCSTWYDYSGPENCFIKEYEIYE